MEAETNTISQLTNCTTELELIIPEVNDGIKTPKLLMLTKGDSCGYVSALELDQAEELANAILECLAEYRQLQNAQQL